MHKCIIKSGCPHCREVLMPIENINMKLPIGKRIQVMDLKHFELFGIRDFPIAEKMPKFSGYPHVHLDNFSVTNILNKKQISAFLEGYFQQDKIYE